MNIYQEVLDIIREKRLQNNNPFISFKEVKEEVIKITNIKDQYFFNIIRELKNQKLLRIINIKVPKSSLHKYKLEDMSDINKQKIIFFEEDKDKVYEIIAKNLKFDSNKSHSITSMLKNSGFSNEEVKNIYGKIILNTYKESQNNNSLNNVVSIKRIIVKYLNTLKESKNENLRDYRLQLNYNKINEIASELNKLNKSENRKKQHLIYCLNTLEEEGVIKKISIPATNLLNVGPYFILSDDYERFSEILVKKIQNLNLKVPVSEFLKNIKINDKVIGEKEYTLLINLYKATDEKINKRQRENIENKQLNENKVNNTIGLRNLETKNKGTKKIKMNFY
ncbi:MAG: hypothetical protein ACP5LH_02955 [Candidatus Micrarchaeia archaeon]